MLRLVFAGTPDFAVPTLRLLADSPDYAAKHSEISLAKIYGMRNRITHAYEEVDMEIVWNLVLFDVPDLLPKIVAALEEFRSEG